MKSYLFPLDFGVFFDSKSRPPPLQANVCGGMSDESSSSLSPLCSTFHINELNVAE